MDTKRHVLVTGAAGVIGSAVVEANLSGDAAVSCVDKVRPEGSDRPGCQWVSKAVTTERDARRAVRQAVEGWGPIHQFVHCAGAHSVATLEEGDLEWWRGLVATNLESSFIWSRAFSEVAASQASIVFIGSVHGSVGPRLHSSCAYSASKAGVVGLTKALAVELASRDITVNCVAPGLVASPMTKRRLDDPEYCRKWFARQPIQRLVSAMDVAGSVMFLGSADARMITGAVIPVDGGLLASS